MTIGVKSTRCIGLLLICLLLIVPGTTLSADPSVTALATGSLAATGVQAEATSDGFIFFVIDITMQPQEGAVGPRQLFGSMFYALEPFSLSASGDSRVLASGDGEWVDLLETHTLDSDGTQAAHFLQIVPTTPEQRGSIRNIPMFQNARVSFESQNLSFAAPGEQQTILERYDFAAGEALAHELAAPTLFRAVTGSFHVTLDDASFTLQAGDYLALATGTSLSITADWANDGQLLSFSIVPAE